MQVPSPWTQREMLRKLRNDHAAIKHKLDQTVPRRACNTPPNDIA